LVDFGPRVLSLFFHGLGLDSLLAEQFYIAANLK
jgi:hypothetical protein